MAETLQQTQTLSLRISEVLRKRLEDIRKLTALRENGVRDQNSGFPLTRCLC